MSEKKTAKIVALIGSTASGKSELALRLAAEHGAEILSCDSLLVYRGLTIGTAKPTPEELGSVPHHAIDIVDPCEPFTAIDYVKYARPIIDELVKKDKPILIVGGTGFYLKALLCGVWDAPPTQPEIRARLEKEESQGLFAKLCELDPEYSTKIKSNDRYRVVRALEIMEVTGESMTALLAKRVLQNPFPHAFTILGIRRKKPELERRIVERTNQMFSKGIVTETKSLLEKYDPVPRPFFCVGYNEVMQFLHGKLTLPECRERTVISTRQLAKKQMTFFKTFPAPIQWIDLPMDEEALLAKASEVLSSRPSGNRVS
jgi:tRNA dimethylallyltransferase